MGFLFDDKALSLEVGSAVRRSQASADATAPHPVAVSPFAAARLGLASNPTAGFRAVADFLVGIRVPTCAVLLGALAASLVAAA